MERQKNDTKWMLRHILYYYIEALNDNEVKFLFYKSHPIRLNWGKIFAFADPPMILPFESLTLT